MIVDDRTESEVEETGAFVIATDSVMSGRGEVPGRSIVARPVKRVKINSESKCANGKYFYYDVDYGELRRVESVFNSHPEFKRVRVVYDNVYKPRLHDGDHLHIYNFNTFIGE